jgi:hypothetical protein
VFKGKNEKTGEIVAVKVVEGIVICEGDRHEDNYE